MWCFFQYCTQDSQKTPAWGDVEQLPSTCGLSHPPVNGHPSTGNREVVGLAHMNSKKKKDYRLLGDNDGIKSRIELFRLRYHHFSTTTTTKETVHPSITICVLEAKGHCGISFSPSQGHGRKRGWDAFLQLLSAENSCCLSHCMAAASLQEAGQSLPALPADRCPRVL